MDRRRYLEWAEHQLRFFAAKETPVVSFGHRRSVRLEGALDLFFEAHPDGVVVVGLETEDEEKRVQWGETFRRTRRGNPPWPPGPPPESVGPIEFSSNGTNRRVQLHFRWMFLGQNFLLELPNVSAGMSWLLLSQSKPESHPREIELPEDGGEPLEIEWDQS